MLINRADSVLLLYRPEFSDWVLPGGSPRAHESMGSCARREVWEETGLDVHPSHCGLVLEVNDPIKHQRTLELVFMARQFDTAASLVGEPGREPQWVGLGVVKTLPLLPPIAGYMPDLVHQRGGGGRYVGNLWRPNRVP